MGWYLSKCILFHMKEQQIHYIQNVVWKHTHTSRKKRTKIKMDVWRLEEGEESEKSGSVFLGEDEYQLIYNSTWQ